MKTLSDESKVRERNESFMKLVKILTMYSSKESSAAELFFGF